MTPADPPPPSPAAPIDQSPRVPSRVSAGSVVLTVLGAVVVLLALAPLGAGGALIWADATQRDADGYFSTRAERFDTASYAITSEEIDLGDDPEPFSWDLGDWTTVRIDVHSVGERPVFVGIARTQDVAEYLRGVAHAEVSDVSVGPFAVEYRHRDGEAPPDPPGDQSFWAASIEGVGVHHLEWEPEAGQWSVVLMNADATSGVSAEVGLAAELPWVRTVGIALAVIGALVLLAGVTMLVFGILGLARAGHVELSTSPPIPGATPIRLTGSLEDPPGRWLWLVKWVLVIPHVVVLVVLWAAFAVVTFVAFFAVLVSGRYPRGLWEFNVGVLRWSWRVAYYSYGVLGTDRYPPFTLGHAPDYPATLEVAYPEQLSRGLVLVKWWLLAIPHYLILGIVGYTVAANDDWGSRSAGGLAALLVLFVGLALLFVGRYPTGLHALLLGINRWIYRVIVYAALLRDEYPPFRLDQGPEEPLRT